MDGNEFTVILDNGHGALTSGKCSPDRRLLEYLYNREIVALIKSKLDALGIKSEIIVPEEREDIPIKARCRRANEIYKKNKNCILISVHVNAMGCDDQWHNAHGWQVCIALNASDNSKYLAELFADAAKEEGLYVRLPMPKQKYWVQNLGICRDTNMPAVLTENLFQDNKDDVDYLLTHKELIADIHVNAIVKYGSRMD